MIDTSNTIEEFSRLRKEYGDVFCFVVGSSPVIVLNGAEAIRDLLVKEADSLSIRPASFFLSKIANSKGLVASNGHLWKEQRSFALKTLRDFGFGKRSLETQIQQEVDSFIRCLEESKGQPVDFVEPLKVCVANVICSMSMGRTYDFEDKRLLSLMEMIDRIFSDPAIRGPASFVPFAKYIPGDPLHFKWRQEIVGKIIAFLGETVEEHKRSLDEDNVRDYIDAFLLAKKKDGKDSESNYSVSWNQYRIPKGATVIGNLHSVSYDPKLFPEPDKFDPERFLDKSGKLNDTHLIIPFGIGRRVCLGEALARMEIFLFLTAVIQRYHLLPEDTNNLPSLEGKLGTTYSPFPYKLRAVPWE